MADLKRVFAQHNADTDQMEWFFMAREGMEGPFASEELALAGLERYIEYCLFDANRVFAQRNDGTDEVEWFFVARDGIEGPFASEDAAQRSLEDYIETKKRERAAARPDA